MNKSFASLFIFLISQICATQVAAQSTFEQVKALLSSSAQAIKTSNYRGFFTYQYGSVLDTVEVIHRFTNNIQVEHVKHLNGPHREFSRRLNETCDLKSSGSISMFPGLGLLEAGQIVSLSEHYNYYLNGVRRYADREATLLQFVPKDKQRYGLVMALDKQTHLPLMVMMLDHKQQPLERFQFVHLDLNSKLPEIEIPPPTGKDCVDMNEQNSLWHARWVPQGFVLTQTVKKDSEERLHFTDGVASFTIFVGPLKNKALTRGGASRRGATTAVMTMAAVSSEPTHITLVGEIPVSTARHIVESVALRN